MSEKDRSGAPGASPLLISTSGLPRVNDSLPPPSASLGQFAPGAMVAGKFTLKRIIATGGTATVYEAWDMLVERSVALKLLHPHLVADQTAVARFRREAQATARVRHPNVVDVLEMGIRSDGTFYMVQELLTGKTLNELLTMRKPLSPERALAIALPIMSGLSAAHSLGIVHRDVKPDNIILTTPSSGEIVPKLIDFGIAKAVKDSGSITHFGAVIGTPHYMSPEQVRGQASDIRVDLWAIAVVLYEMLAGSRPFADDVPIMIMTHIATKAPIPFEAVAPKNVRQYAPIFKKALAAKIDERYPTVLALRDALLQIAGGHPQPILAEDVFGQSEKPSIIPLNPLTQLPIINDDLTDDGEDTDSVAHDEDDDGVVSIGSPQSVIALARVANAGANTPADLLAKAERALEVNALSDAFRHAEQALAQPNVSPDIQGRLLLTCAVASRWQGDLNQSMKAAQEALARLARGSKEWHLAFDCAVIAQGQFGRKERLLARADELKSLEEEGDISLPSAFVASASRLARYVLRAGVPRLAVQLARGARRYAERQKNLAPEASAWLEVVRGEISLHEGDPFAHMRRLETAIDQFTAAQDMRMVCQTQFDYGLACLALGAKDNAASILETVLGLAEPMALDIVPAVKASLGLVLAHIGQLKDAAELTAAAEKAKIQPNPDVESACWLAIARVRKLNTDNDSALALAKKAVDISADLPGRRAHALAFFASLQIGRGHFDVALKSATEAFTTIERLGGIEEGEALIRLVYALALRAAGQEAEGRKRIAEARTRLYDMARRLGDTRWQNAFLTAAPDNARILSVASQWIGDAPMP
jgi:eukaryotic-like serine/threonine-protein kinase